MNPWEQIKQQLEATLNAESYANWVSHTSFSQLTGGVLRVFVPNAESKTWMETEYANQVGAIIRKLNLPIQAVLYEPAKAVAVREAYTAGNGEREIESESPSSQLNPRFTFDTFVV